MRSEYEGCDDARVRLYDEHYGDKPIMEPHCRNCETLRSRIAELEAKVLSMRNCGNCGGADECADNGARNDCLRDNRLFWTMLGAQEGEHSNG